MEKKEYFNLDLAIQGSQAQRYGGQRVSIDGYGETEERVNNTHTNWIISLTTLTLRQSKEIVSVLQKQIEEVEKKV